MQMEILTTDQGTAWMQVLERSKAHDFYHLPQYHALAESCGEGKAYLLHYMEGGFSLALPLLVRPVDTAPGVAEEGAGWCDATSVYGYAGPIASHAEVPDSVIGHFQAGLRCWLQDQGIVAIFSRLHPLLQQQYLLQGLGECQTLWRTVSIDLTLPIDAQRAFFRRSHKKGIGRLRRAGVTCVSDPDGVFFDDFLAIYYETMRRVGAAQAYFFPRAYFLRLREALGERFNLCVCRHDGRIVAGGIFVEYNGFLQCHLAGTATSALKLAPMKLLVDEMRRWASARGMRVLHLGGGLTTRPDDPLLHFKAGFSDRRHEFRVWRWILHSDVYRRLCDAKASWNARHRLEVAKPNFFCEYRCPTAQSALPSPQFGAAQPNRLGDAISEGERS